MLRLIAIAGLLCALLAISAVPAFAQGCGTVTYFDQTNGNDTTGNGLIGTPFKTQAKADGTMRALTRTGTGCLYELVGGRQSLITKFTAITPASGVPLPTPVLYGLLLAAAVLLVLAGWWLQRRATVGIPSQ